MGEVLFVGFVWSFVAFPFYESSYAQGIGKIWPSIHDLST